MPLQSYCTIFLGDSCRLCMQELLQRCQTANKVLFVLPAPLWDSYRNKYASGTGHFIVVLIDQL